MGTEFFTNFYQSIKVHIHRLNIKGDVLERQIKAIMAGSEGRDPDIEEAANLVEAQHELSQIPKAIEKLKNFYVEIAEQWKKPQNRVIGHVVWAPPISVSSTPHNYTKDVCVVKLDEKKFLPNFKRNVLDLGRICLIKST